MTKICSPRYKRKGSPGKSQSDSATQHQGTRKKAKPNGAEAVNTYLASLPTHVRAGLVKLKNAIAAAAPEAEVGISYGIPAFRLNGRPLVWFAAFKKHCSFFPAARAIRVHAAALKPYKTSKGTLQFPPGKPPAARLVAKLIKTRISELQKTER
jgi:uncharacterized protein YdhG (YjbR/CyaY superfamily)